MKKILLIVVPILLIAGLIFFFRPSKGIDKNLVLAEQLMNERPDSALQILEKMKVSNFGGENRALYALLMTQAQFKNRKPVESDSLIKVAYEYFVIRKDSIRKSQSYLYYGRVAESLGKTAEAIRSYQKASAAALPTMNTSLLALINYRWSILLQEQNLLDDALHLLENTLNYSEQDKDTIMQIYTLKEFGRVYSLKKEFNDALFYFKSALNLALLIRNEDLAFELYKKLGVLYKFRREYPLAMHYVNKSISLLDSSSTYSSYLLKGEIFSDQQQYDSARYYFSKAIKNNDLYSKAGCCLFMSKLEKKEGRFEEALKYSNQYIAYADTLENNKREAAIAELQKKYDYSLIKNENIQLELQKESRSVLILIVLVISIISIWIISYRYKKLRHEKDEIIKEGHEQLQQMADALIEWEMRLKAIKLKSKEELDAFVKWVLSKNEAMRKIERLAKMDTCEIIAHKDELKLTPSEIENLKEVVDICFDGFATRLAHNFPSISEENIQFSCLMRMKIPASSIAVLLGVTDGTLVKRKYRFKKDMNEIIEGFSSLENFLLNF